MAVSRTSHASFDQGAAATTELVAAPAAGYRIVVHGITIGIGTTGTAQLLSAATALTGAIPIAASDPKDLLAGSDMTLQCAAAEALNLTTVTGAAKGVVFYSTEQVGA